MQLKEVTLKNKSVAYDFENNKIRQLFSQELRKEQERSLCNEKFWTS